MPWVHPGSYVQRPAAPGARLASLVWLRLTPVASGPAPTQWGPDKSCPTSQVLFSLVRSLP